MFMSLMTLWKGQSVSLKKIKEYRDSVPCFAFPLCKMA